MIQLDTRKTKLGNIETKVLLLNQEELSEYLYTLTNNQTFKSLVLSWTNLAGNELKYVLDLLDTNHSSNIPILVCPDDVDLWCTIVVAKTKFIENQVIWDKIGFVKGKYDVEAWRTSGLQNTELWTDEDWIFFDEDYLDIKSGRLTWDGLSSKYWDMEELLRIKRYLHEYFNEDKNIEWVYKKPLRFDKYNFQEIIKQMIQP